jgi:hypothetical protein
VAEILTEELRQRMVRWACANTGAVNRAIWAALHAMRVAEAAVGDWKPEAGHQAGACEIVEAIQGRDWHARNLTDEQVEAGTVEESDFHSSFLRLRAGGREWIIEVEPDSDGEGGTKDYYRVRASGEVSRG